MAASFEAGLRTLERHDRPANYPGFNAETRRLASDAQFLTFYEKYWSDWRHTKLRAYRFLMSQREAFLGSESERMRTAGWDPATVIYQEFTNGIIASAISEFCQYAEDFGLLCDVVRSDGFFVRDLASAHAGRIQQRVLTWIGISEEEVAKLLHIPWFPNRQDWEHSEIGQAYVGGIRLAQERIRAISAFYKTWQPHFMRYKHGLLFALRYASGVRDEEFLARHRSSFGGFPVAFDCGSVAEAIDGDGHQVLVLPDISEKSRDVRLNASHLAAERNLLREIHPSAVSGDPTIDSFIEIGAWISQCQHVLLTNRRLEISPEQWRPYHLPHENPAATFAIYRDPKPNDAPSSDGGTH